MKVRGSPYGQYPLLGLFLVEYYLRILYYIAYTRLAYPSSLDKDFKRHKDKKPPNDSEEIAQYINELIKKYSSVSSGLKEDLEDLLNVLRAVRKYIERLNRDVNQYEFIKRVEVTKKDLNSLVESFPDTIG